MIGDPRPLQDVMVFHIFQVTRQITHLNVLFAISFGKQIDKTSFEEIPKERKEDLSTNDMDGFAKNISGRYYYKYAVIKD